MTTPGLDKLAADLRNAEYMNKVLNLVEAEMHEKPYSRIDHGLRLMIEQNDALRHTLMELRLYEFKMSQSGLHSKAAETRRVIDILIQGVKCELGRRP